MCKKRFFFKIRKFLKFNINARVFTSALQAAVMLFFGGGGLHHSWENGHK